MGLLQPSLSPSFLAKEEALLCLGRKLLNSRRRRRQSTRETLKVSPSHSPFFSPPRNNYPKPGWGGGGRHTKIGRELTKRFGPLVRDLTGKKRCSPSLTSLATTRYGRSVLLLLLVAVAVVPAFHLHLLWGGVKNTGLVHGRTCNQDRSF